MQLKLTVVVTSAIQVDGKLMCEMSDGNVEVFTCWLTLSIVEMSRFRYLTAEQVRDMCLSYNNIYAAMKSPSIRTFNRAYKRLA